MPVCIIDLHVQMNCYFEPKFSDHISITSMTIREKYTVEKCMSIIETEQS